MKSAQISHATEVLFVTLIGVKVYSWKHESPLFIAESNMNLPDQTTMHYWNRVTYLLK